MTETEIKLPVGSVASLRRRLLQAGFKPTSKRLLERNILFDTPSLDLRRSFQLLRLRSKGNRWWLTFKSGSRLGTRHKVREEFEVEVQRGERMVEILRRMGYRPIFEYHKYRTEFTKSGSRGDALLDETPIGNFLELEGTPRWIDRVARELGYELEDYILGSYGSLYVAWCRERRVSPGSMTFPGKKGLHVFG